MRPRMLAGAGLILAVLSLGCRESAAPPPLEMVDLFTFRQPTRLALSGIEGQERDEAGTWRWLLGPRAVARFQAQRSRPYSLRFRLMNPLPEMVITVSANGRVLATYGPLPAARWLAPSVDAALTFDAVAGENELAFAFSDWNGRDVVHMPTDKRPLAAVFLEFVLYAR
ncbi:hypothetical protein [Solidesulfovibrio sp.]